MHNVFDTLCGQVGGSWALEIESFLGPVKWHRADRRVPFGAQKTPVHKYVYRDPYRAVHSAQGPLNSILCPGKILTVRTGAFLGYIIL